MKALHISDTDVLDMLIDGTLLVDIQTAAVTSRGVLLKPELTVQSQRPGTRTGMPRYRIRFRLSGNRRRWIVRAKLVYMAATLQVIPDGYEIHHIDGDRFNDAYHNLALLSIEDHKKFHDGFSYENRAVSNTPF